MKTHGNNEIKDMTVREYFAAQALQGILSGPLMTPDDPSNDLHFHEIPALAVSYADELVRALNKDPASLQRRLQRPNYN